MGQTEDTLDFIVIGAQKGGTTTLFEYLRRHPELSLPCGKELPYFSHDAMYRRGWSAYISSLAREAGAPEAQPVKMLGTVTPQYMVGAVFQSSGDDRAGYDERTVPSRIHERLPDVRLIAILRDPVERAISHHRMLVKRGHERRSFDEAIEDLLHPRAIESARTRPQETTGYVVRGEYGRILAGYFDVFPAKQIMVTFTNELKEAPVELLARIQEFLGVTADFAPDNLGRMYRVGGLERVFSWTSPSSWMSPGSPISPQGVQRAMWRSSAARVLWNVIPRERRRDIAARFERVAHRSARRNRRGRPNEVRANVAPSGATLARLREYYAADAHELAELLGATPPWQ